MDDQSAMAGGCLCGAIRYQVAWPPTRTNICHCRMCQRWSGSAFAVGAEFPADAVSWTKEPTLFQSSERGFRSFCSQCGSSIGYHWPDDGAIWLVVGTFDEPVRASPQCHIFSEEQMPWADIDDSLTRHPQFSPQ